MPGSVTKGVAKTLGPLGSTIGAYGQYRAGQDMADAMGSAAEAQQAQAQNTIAAMQAQAAPTALELSTMNSQIQQANTQVQRQQKIFDAMDPAILESGKQALQLMQGQNASTIAPMLAQRQVQRQQMMQQLQNQLGPGFATSSAGQQALANFDNQTNTFQAGLQQQALSAVGTYGTQAAQAAQSGMASGQQAGQLFSNVMGQSNTIQQRQVNATYNGSNALIATAGAPWVSAIGRAMNTSQMFGQLGSLGAKWGQAMTPGAAPMKDPNDTSNNSSSSSSGGGMSNPFGFGGFSFANAGGGDGADAADAGDAD